MWLKKMLNQIEAHWNEWTVTKYMMTQVDRIHILTLCWVVYVKLLTDSHPIITTTASLSSSIITAAQPLLLVYLIHCWRNPNVVSRWHTQYSSNWMPNLCPSPSLLLTIVERKCVGSNLNSVSSIHLPKTLNYIDIFHCYSVTVKSLFLLAFL